MKKYLSIFLKYVLPLGLGAFLFWYVVLRNQSIAEITTTIKGANPFWIFVSFGLGALSHLIRAYRWKYLLEPLGHKLHIGKGFIAVMVGYFANLLVPRMGEVSRCGVLQKMTDIPANTSFGTVITERVIDLCMLVLLMGVFLLVEFENFGTLILSSFSGKVTSVKDNIPLLIGVALVALLLLWVLYRFWKKKRASLEKNAIYNKFSNFLSGIWAGVKSVKDVKNIPAFIIQTVLIWVLYYLMAYTLFFCYDETKDLGLMAGYATLIMGAIGMAAPIQGGVGAYHYLVSRTLTVYGISEGFGLSFATFMHTMQSAVIIILGALCALLSILIGKAKNK